VYMRVTKHLPLYDPCVMIDDHILKTYASKIHQNARNFAFAALVKHELFHRADIFLRVGADVIYMMDDVKLFTASSYMYLIERAVGKDLILPTALSKNNTPSS